MAIEETWLRPIVQQAAKRGGRMFDIGANRGDWTRALAASMDSVKAFEPDPRAYEELVAGTDCLDNVTTHQMAVAAESGTVTLTMRSGTAQSSLGETHPFGHGENIGMVTIESIALPDVLWDGGEFVKIDIEGAEVDLEYPSNVEAYLIECHGTFDAMVKRIPADYLIYRFRHPHPVADAQGHCWIYCTKEPLHDK